MSEENKDALAIASAHLYLIRAHMESLHKLLYQLKRERYSNLYISLIRRGALDIRLIIEEMMHLSVSSHVHAGKEVSKTLRREWNAAKKMRKLRDLNPNFFPDAVSLVDPGEAGVAFKIVSVEEDYLTADKATYYYDWCSKYLHATHNHISEEECKHSLFEISLFFKLTERLLRQFEVDISGTGVVVLGQLDLGNERGPTLGYAGGKVGDS